MIQPTAAEQIKKKDRSKLAVSLAMERKWDDAVVVNREILEETPENVEALNRMAKALTELGRYSEARAAFKQVLTLTPSNTIAKKNLERIAQLRDEDAPKATGQAVPAHFFIEETGKTGLTVLIDMAPQQVTAKLTAGETLRLEPQEHKLLVKNGQGEYVGTVEPKLGLRLLRMVRGGNRYEAAIASIQNGTLRIIIRETYQHPSQQGRLSFPPKGQDGFKGYVWEGASRFMAEDEDEGPADSADEPSDDEGGNLEDVSSYKRRSRSKKALDLDGEEEEA